MLLEKDTLELLKELVSGLESGFELPPVNAGCNTDEISEVLWEVCERMKDNYPYFHPFYMGQMLKPPHPAARAAYMLAMWLNPNNHAIDGGRASSVMEKEVVASIAAMFGWKEHLGHLTGGGTIANTEALWISGKIRPGMLIAASDQAHYTHQRLCGLLGIGFEKVPGDDKGRMDINYLKNILERGNIGTVVATMGTTGLGAVDPLEEILELRENYGFRIHADAAYGGYFRLADNLPVPTKRNLELISEADSIVIDPHKHGLQPYGCGCVIFRDSSVVKYYLHDSPYTYFSSDELHLGEISLECSRPGASAVGLWATIKLMPLIRGGEFSENISKSHEAALRLSDKLKNNEKFIVFFEPELDIAVWAIRGKSTQEMSDSAVKFFKNAEMENLFLSLLKYPTNKLVKFLPGIDINSESLTCLRSCLMKPEHLDWMDRLWEKIESVSDKLD